MKSTTFISSGTMRRMKIFNSGTMKSTTILDTVVMRKTTTFFKEFDVTSKRGMSMPLLSIESRSTSLQGEIPMRDQDTQTGKSLIDSRLTFNFARYYLKTLSKNMLDYIFDFTYVIVFVWRRKKINLLPCQRNKLGRLKNKANWSNGNSLPMKLSNSN